MYEYVFFRRHDGRINLHFNQVNGGELCSDDDNIFAFSINIPMNEEDLRELSKAIHKYFDTKS